MSLTRNLARINADSDGSISTSGTFSVGTSTNLLSNAEFTTNTTGWAATTSTLAIVSNELQLTPDSGANGFANQQVDNLVVGRSYIASVTVTVDAGALARLYIGTSANGNQTLATYNIGTGTHSYNFTATATTHHFALVVGGGTGQVTRFDNAKLIEANKVIFPAGYGKVDGILAVDRATSDGTIIDMQKNGTSVGSIGVDGGSLHVGGGDVGAGFYQVADAIVPINNGTGALRDNAISLGISSGRFKDMYLSGGIYMQGSTTAVQFDDYEEGDWTPTLQDLSGNQASAYSSGYPKGTYTKVGRHVWINFSIRITNKGSMTGNYVHVGNLPFNRDASAEGRGTGTIDYYSGFASSKSYLALDCSSTTAVMWLVGGTNATGSGYVSVSQLNNACMFKGGANYIAA